jgi:hemerythrin-like metal-binding protein
MISSVVWKPCYSVGNRGLDAQHREILSAVNSLYQAVKQGKSRSALRPLLDRLMHCANTHFSYEEDIMRHYAYPGLAQHEVFHEWIRQEMNDLRNNLGLAEDPELLRYLKKLWLNHIQGQDSQYSPYLEVPAESN